MRQVKEHTEKELDNCYFAFTLDDLDHKETWFKQGFESLTDRLQSKINKKGLYAIKLTLVEVIEKEPLKIVR